MNRQSKLSLNISLLIIVLFFAIQTAIVFGFLEPSYSWAVFGYGCVILFSPFFGIFALNFHFALKEREQQYNDKIQAIQRSSLFLVLSSRGVIKDVNTNILQLLGYKRDELIGKNHKVLVPDHYRNSDSYREFWMSILQGKFCENRFERVGKDGATHWIEGTYNPICNAGGAVYEVILIAHNIQDRMEKEMELIKKNKYLEHSAKILRHDMHSGINTYIPRGLRSLKRRLSNEKIKELKIEAPLKLIEEGLRHTQRVYEGVKEFTNLVKDGVELHKEERNIGDLLVEYIENTAYNDQVAIDQLPFVAINPALFCTAIDNMIRNGLKYNDSEFKMVAITMVDDEHLAVIDNGRGMTQEEFDHLSQPYQRKTGQVESGTGLGLNITVAILKEHEFPVTVHKQENGTMIKVKIR